MDTIWPILFGQGVGEVKLGVKLADFLNKVVPEEFPRLKVNVIAPSPMEMFSVGTSVDLIDFGILCTFHAKTEEMLLIKCYNFSKIGFNLKGLVFGAQIAPSGRHQGASVAATPVVPSLAMIQKALGPFFPGKFVGNSEVEGDSSGHPYLLTLNGISLLFSTSLSSPSSECVLKEFFVYPAHLELENGLSLRNPPASVHHTFISLHRRDRNTLDKARSFIVVPGNNGDYHELRLGMSPQDIVSKIGSPDIASTVHAPADSPGPAGATGGPSGIVYPGAGCTCWKYHVLGVELFFSSTHTLFRAIVRTNLPVHADFCLFHRCPFIVLNGDSTSVDKVRTALENTSVSELTVPSETKVTPPVPPTTGKKGKVAVNPPSKPSSACASMKNSSGSGKQQSVCGGSTGMPEALFYYDDWVNCLQRLKSWFNVDTGDGPIHDSAAVQLPPECSPFLPTKLFAYPELNAVVEVLSLPNDDSPNTSGGVDHSVAWIASVCLCEPDLM